MPLNKEQEKSLSKYFSDLSKIIVASAVINYFIPSDDYKITIVTFIIGAMIAFASLYVSIKLLE